MRKIVMLMVAVTLAAASCGADDGDGGNGGGGGGADAPVDLSGPVEDHGTGTVEGGTVELEVDDSYFAPTYIEAEPGETVTVEIVNEGDAQHTFTIEDLGIDETIAPGDRAEVEVNLPASGRAVFTCRFHQGQGMQGAFFVP